MGERMEQSTRRRFPVLVVVSVVVFAGLYAGVVFLYAQGGRTDVGTPIDNSRQGLHVVLTPRDVDAATDRIRFDLAFGPDSGPLLTSDGYTIAEDFRLLLSSAANAAGQVMVFETGKPVAPSSVELRTSGTIEHWPFDTHPSQTLVLVSAQPANSGEPQAVSADVSLAPHHVPGWNITIREDTTAPQATAEGGVVVQQYVIEAQRATAPVVFGIVLIALMLIMPVLGLTVAIMALRGHRRVEIGFFTWNAGMLFATPTLRNFLPGQPPVGSWVDYLVVLWVVAGLILALLISVVAWYRWGRPQAETIP